MRSWGGGSGGKEGVVEERLLFSSSQCGQAWREGRRKVGKTEVHTGERRGGGRGRIGRGRTEKMVALAGGIDKATPSPLASSAGWTANHIAQLVPVTHVQATAAACQ